MRDLITIFGKTINVMNYLHKDKNLNNVLTFYVTILTGFAETNKRVFM